MHKSRVTLGGSTQALQYEISQEGIIYGTNLASNWTQRDDQDTRAKLLVDDRPGPG